MADTSRPAQRFTVQDGVTLRDYFDSRLSAVEKATELASRALEKRLEGMNEFRASLGDLTGRMATREELGLQLEKIKADIEDLKRSRDEASGKASQTSVIVSMLLGVAGLIIGIISLLGGG